MLGLGATGYAADMLEETLHADVNIVETVAHMMSAMQYFADVDVICDIGGQDIKVLLMATATSAISGSPTSAPPATGCCYRRWPTSSASR